MIEIPICRGLKLGTKDEYVEGSLIETEEGIFIYSKDYYSDFDNSNSNTTHVLMNTQLIDTTTLAIHFPSMIDSEGNKIFASLSSCGKGGDYTNTHKLPVVFQWDNLNACVCLAGKYEYTALFKDGTTHEKVSSFNKYKVIGIAK